MKKVSDLMLIIVCSVFLVSFGIWIFAAPQRTFSEEENRVLEGFPKVSAENIANGRFSKSLGSFYGDQFPVRRGFTSLKAFSELSMLRRENNGVIFGEDGYLIARHEYDDLSLYRENLRAVKRFCESCKERGIEVRVLFAPRGVDVLGEYLPSIYFEARNEEIWSIAESEIEGLLSVREEIERAASEGAYVWFKTDHHWTALGAYEGYRKISESFGESPEPLSRFNEQSVSRSFFGSVWSRAGISVGESDEVILFRREDENYRVINYDEGKTYDSLYFFEKLDSKDKYGVFLGGNFGHIGIYREGERETLLLVKDSFANSAVPYLACGYNLEIYDLRYFDGKISDEIAALSPDKIVILYGIDTAITDASLKLLGR